MDLNEIAITIPCYYCKANPGFWCRTATGAHAYFLHGDRTNPINNAYGVGYCERDDEARS